METFSRITRAFVRRPGYGNAFERSNTNIVEEAVSYAAKPVSTEELTNLDLLWNVNYLRRMHTLTAQLARSDAKLGGSLAKKFSKTPRQSNSATSQSNVSSDNPGSTSTASTSANGVPPATADRPQLTDEEMAVLLLQRSKRGLCSRFEPENVEEDIEVGYFFRPHWWGDEDWRKLVQLLALQKVRAIGTIVVLSFDVC